MLPCAAGRQRQDFALIGQNAHCLHSLETDLLADLLALRAVLPPLQEEYDAEIAQQLQQQQDGGRPRPQAAPPLAATSAAAPQQTDYLTGGFYPQVHHAEQPGSAPPVGTVRRVQRAAGPTLAGAARLAD